eukprot:Pgem_evm1s17517
MPDISFALKSADFDHKESGALYLTNYRFIFLTFPVSSSSAEQKNHEKFSDFHIAWEDLAKNTILYSTHKIHALIDNEDVKK